MGPDPLADGQMGKEREDTDTTYSPRANTVIRVGQPNKIEWVSVVRGQLWGLQHLEIDRDRERGELMNSPVSLVFHIHNLVLPIKMIFQVLSCKLVVAGISQNQQHCFLFPLDLGDWSF